SQLIVLACFALKAALNKKSLLQERIGFYIDQLLLLPGKISELLNHTDQYRKIAESILNSRSVLYIGRGASYAVASEGALKLKELSYIHAESIQAGELKHGPIALIDENVSVIAIAPDDDLINKTLSNVHSIIARKGNVTLISDIKENTVSKKCQHHFSVISSDSFTTPILYNIPLQLISYYAATLSGKNVDQPRNLAKSVTVE
nr:SIS domain-containing protein [Alphaproteobacteria bacterium]